MKLLQYVAFRAAIGLSSPSDVENSCLFGALERHRKWLLAFVTEKNKPAKSLKASRYRKNHRPYLAQ